MNTEQKEQNSEFIRRCRRIDFSAESANMEGNLRMLQSKLPEIIKGEKIKMKSRKPLAIIGISAAALLCLSFTVYGGTIINTVMNIIRTVTVGEHASYSAVNYSFPLPEDTVFDKDGNEITAYTGNETAVFDKDGNESKIFIDEDGQFSLMSAEEFDKKVAEVRSKADAKPITEKTVFTDLDEGLSRFHTEILMPDYLPEGYAFNRVEYYAGVFEDSDTSKYADIIYSNGTDEFGCSLRFMDEETAYVFSTDENIEMEEITLNGHEALLVGKTLDIQIGDVMYGFSAGDAIDRAELVKIAESLN